MTRGAATRLATTGVYEYVRHPQYVGFIIILLGFLIQWPTLLTLLMFLVFVVMYVRLGRIEEREVLEEFSDHYLAYRQQVPGFLPWFGARQRARVRSEAGRYLAGIGALP